MGLLMISRTTFSVCDGRNYFVEFPILFMMMFVELVIACYVKFVDPYSQSDFLNTQQLSYSKAIKVNTLPKLSNRLIIILGVSDVGQQCR
jgi:hypothetical protein